VQASAAVPARYQSWSGRCERVLDAADFIGTRLPSVDIFMDLCSRVQRDSTEDWRVLSIVDPYSDTMLNRIQQMQLRDEFERIRRRPDLLAGAGPTVERISAALERTLDGDGAYVTFIGE
jgi:hypothetical protein